MNENRTRDPWGAPELFVISQTALPAMLYLPGTQAIRLPLRTGAFAIALGLLGWWFVTTQGKERARHPSVPWVLSVLGMIVLMAFHPQTSSPRGAAASLMLYLCIASPLFWAPSMVRTPTRLRRLVALLLICNGLNSIVGVLQVYDPARWLPDQFSRAVTESELGLGPVSYIGATGQLVIRPPGLFDTPGAVSGPGAFAALLGLIFAATRFRWYYRAGSLLLASAGFAAIYLSHVRVSFVVTLAMIGAYGGVLLVQRRLGHATVFGGIAAAALACAFTVAMALGGASIAERFATLFERDPVSVYYTARGGQLVYAFTDSLFEFPFGAGLARWGMIGAYFGAPSLDRPSLWAEIQLAGWIFDGGVVLMVLYCAALVVAAATEFRLARSATDPTVAASAATIFAANLAPILMCISFTPFVTQSGVQYWFLVGALHGVAREQAARMLPRYEGVLT
jgi:hypothetical protein